MVKIPFLEDGIRARVLDDLFAAVRGVEAHSGLLHTDAALRIEREKLLVVEMALENPKTRRFGFRAAKQIHAKLGKRLIANRLVLEHKR